MSAAPCNPRGLGVAGIVPAAPATVGITSACLRQIDRKFCATRCAGDSCSAVPSASAWDLLRS